MEEALQAIALDAMGGDHGPQVVVPSACEILAEYPNLNLILVGREDLLEPWLPKDPQIRSRLQIQHASEKVEANELPSKALRGKKDSSMRVAINLVKEGRAGACVSAGNTGALMATAKFVLKTLPGIDRPAIMTTLPTKNDERVSILDLGANVDSSAEQLFQFAVMGSILEEALEGNTRPRVALLNIGQESIKGNEQVKKTAELLTQCEKINYVGSIEGDAIFSGAADVIVCDGFVGNILLKTCEGLAQLIGLYTREAFSEDIFSRLAAVPAMPVLKRLRERLDPRKRNGATLLGLNGVVVKSHGSADVLAFTYAIREAVKEMNKNVPQRIAEKVKFFLDLDKES